MGIIISNVGIIFSHVDKKNTRVISFQTDQDLADFYDPINFSDEKKYRYE